MTLTEFKTTLGNKVPPPGISNDLLALWLDAKGNWNRAHEIVQKSGSHTSNWIHAYLHRKEGDLSNAGYWYRRIGRHSPQQSLTEEWEVLADYVLKSEFTE